MTDMGRTPEDILQIPARVDQFASAASVPTFYADLAWYASIQNGNVRITFMENVADAPNTNFAGWKGRPVINLVLPLAGATNMLEYVGNFLQEMQKQGIINVGS